ncbi:MAG: sporulation protein YqfD [Clostridia bacterium]|nr:sporulation protein YqfD [Clostridia bacterium]
MDISTWLSGSLLLSVSGKYPERFVNLCALRGIYIKDAVKTEDGIVFKASPKAFRKMTVPSYRASCRVKIVKKTGFPFEIRKLLKRKILLCGAGLFLMLILFLNSFIWTIRIDGNEKISKEEIKILASYCGLRQGVVKYKVDEKDFSEKALLSEPRLSWIWPEIKGTVCYIHVREKEIGKMPIDTKEPCDVIAKRSGVIRTVTAKRGWAKVGEGDSVVKGQVLISSEKEGFEPVHAMGEVYASYWVEEGLVARTEKEIITYTGREKNYYSVVMGSFGMTFRFSGKAPFECYEEKREEKNLMLFGEIPLPLKIIKTEYKEAVKDKITVNENIAVKEAEKEIVESFEKSIREGTEIKATLLKTERINEKEIRVTVVFECIENIALTQKKD